MYYQFQATPIFVNIIPFIQQEVDEDHFILK